MKMDLTKQPKWVQKHIEGLVVKLDLSVECIDLLNKQVASLETQKTAYNSDYAKCPNSKACHNYPDDTKWCKSCIRSSGLKDNFA